MSWKKTLRDYILSVEWDKKHKVKIKVKNKKYREEVAQIFTQNQRELTSGWATEKEWMKGEGLGDEFKLLMNTNSGGEVLYNNIMNIVTDSSLDQEPPISGNTSSSNGTATTGSNVVAGKVSGTILSGKVSGTVPSGQVSGTSGSVMQGESISKGNKKTMFIVAGASLLFIVIILLLWLRK